jgi:hypothetical protein
MLVVHDGENKTAPYVTKGLFDVNVYFTDGTVVVFQGLYTIRVTDEQVQLCKTYWTKQYSASSVTRLMITSQ